MKPDLWHKRDLTFLRFDLDVAAPSDFELPYENLELKTPDGIMLRCYLLPQKKDLEPGATFMDIPKEMSEDEVSNFLFPLMYRNRN